MSLHLRYLQQRLSENSEVPAYLSESAAWDWSTDGEFITGISNPDAPPEHRKAAMTYALKPLNKAFGPRLKFAVKGDEIEVRTGTGLLGTLDFPKDDRVVALSIKGKSVASVKLSGVGGWRAALKTAVEALEKR